MDAPNSFRDPYYTQLAQSTEQKLELPPGLLQSIITRGERSNADQVSEDGARTVAQIIPSTRKAALDKFGIDAYLNAPNAIEVAGRLLKDSLDRNQGDVGTAVAEYHGGTDPANWGPRTKAYQGRVLGGMDSIQTKSMGDDFASFMAAHPAVPAATAAPKQADALSQDFASWHSAQPTGQAPTIPQTADGDSGIATPTPDKPLGIGDALTGAGEAALTALTAPAGILAGVGSEVSDYSKGIANTLANKLGVGGQDVPIGNIDANAQAASQQFTYEPKTDAGRRFVGALSDFLNESGAGALMGMGGEMAALHAMSAPVGQAVSDAAKVAPGVAAKAVGAVKDAAAKLGIGGGAAAATPEMAGVGAAETAMAAQRTARAEAMPVPITLTKGQATRDYAQQRFEQETAKDPGLGASLRENAADQNQKVLRNFDAMVDMTGAEAPTLRATGEAVDSALKTQMQADKNAVRVAYKKAETAGEMEEPVSLDALVQHLNESAPDAATAPLLDVARARALRLGVATQDDAGNLVAQPVPLKIAETYRQAINRATDFEPTNMRQAAIIKQAVDQGTEGRGGQAYQAARALRARYAQNYEQRATIAKLLDTKRGTADRAVALEDVFQHTMLNSSADDVANVRRVLQRAGPNGWQSWRELQGATMRYIRDEATKNVSNDIRSNPIVSAARLNQVVRGLDHDGKLDLIFGKKGAQTVRDLADLSKDIYTSPPGAVNSSNTASVLLAALTEAGITGSLTGLPVPILSGLRVMAQQVKNRRIQQRVSEALGTKRGPTH